MKWLVLASSLTEKNGYGVLCGSIVDALKRTGRVQPEVVTADGSGSFQGGGRLIGMRIALRPRLWPLYVLRDLCTLYRLTRGRSGYAGVLVLVEHYGPVGWLFARLHGIPCVITQCGSYAIRFPDEIPFFRTVLRRAARVLPISRYTRRRMEEEGTSAQYSVVGLGVDPSRFRQSDAPRAREVLFVGNLKARKGFDFLLDALALAQRAVPDVRVRVVGRLDRESPEFTEILARITRENLNVDFAGGLDDAALAEAYARARLNALPSRSDRFYFEGFGLIHLEANACGTLTVGTRESGNEDAIAEGFGSLVEYGNAPALAAVIIGAMTVDPYPRLPVEKLRTWDDVGLDYAEILEHVV